MPLLLTAARLIDGTGSAAIRPGAVLIEGDRVVAVGAHIAAPADAERIGAVTSATRSRAALSERMLFAATFVCFVIWELGGHVDVWYHQHYGFAIESFATWPHALLYVGWIASAAPAAAYLFESRALGLPRSAWLPPGYRIHDGCTSGDEDGLNEEPDGGHHMALALVFTVFALMFIGSIATVAYVGVAAGAVAGAGIVALAVAALLVPFLFVLMDRRGPSDALARRERSAAARPAPDLARRDRG